MPKAAKKSDTTEQHNAIARYALERAGGVVKKLGETELEPGSYPFALEVAISGELLVEQASPPGDTQTIAGVGQGEALAGLLGSLPESERTRVVSEGLGVWKNADKAGQDALLASMQSTLLAACKKRRMTKLHTPSGRKGAVKCKPSVRITGSAGSQAVSVEVSAE